MASSPRDAAATGGGRLARVIARRWIALAVVLGGCALEQRMASEVVAPRLRAEGEVLDAGAAPRGEARLGRYAVRGIARESEARGEALLPAGPARPSTFYRVTYEVASGEGAGWTGRCAAERRIARNADLAAESEEGADEVALRCELRDPEGRAWTMTAAGDVGRGLRGEVRAAAAATRAFEVEVIADRAFALRVRRSLPMPVGQLRRGGEAAAAMLLDAPERAWLAPGLAAAERDLAIAALWGLRLLPLGEVG